MIKYLLSPLAQRTKVDFGTRYVLAPAHSVLYDLLLLLCEGRSFSTSSVHRYFGRSTSCRLSTTRTSHVGVFLPFFQRYPNQRLKLDFSNDIQLRHNLLQLLVLSDLPATILPLRSSQNLTEDFSFGDVKASEYQIEYYNLTCFIHVYLKKTVSQRNETVVDNVLYSFCEMLV